MVMWKKGRTKRISSVHEKRNLFSVINPAVENIRISNIYSRSDLIIDERRRDASFYASSPGIRISGTTYCITLGAMLVLSRSKKLPSTNGAIVFTETMDWSIEQVEESFSELAQANALLGAKAVFLTALTERTDRKVHLYPELRDGTKIRTLCEFISDLLSLPVLYGFPLGHGAYKLTLPQGVDCTVDSTDGSINLLEPPVN